MLSIKFLSSCLLFLCVMANNLELLLFIAKSAGLYSTFSTSTGKISQKFGVSQQTISRKLRELEKKGLVSRRAFPQGMELSLTEKSKALLENHYFNLKKIFESPKSLKGKVRFGIGEGAYYVRKYNPFFQKELGFKAFPGTLNLKVSRSRLLRFLQGLQKTRLSAFQKNDRSFGSLNCFKVSIPGLKETVFLVLPERSHLPENMVEIISPANLRKKLGLKDNQLVELKKVEGESLA